MIWFDLIWFDFLGVELIDCEGRHWNSVAWPGLIWWLEPNQWVNCWVTNLNWNTLTVQCQNQWPRLCNHGRTSDDLIANSVFFARCWSIRQWLGNVSDELIWWKWLNCVQVISSCCCYSSLSCSCGGERATKTDRLTDSPTNRQTDRQTDRQRKKRAGKWWKSDGKWKRT